MTRARNLARLGNQNIITADTNFNVGIGSLTPDAKLDVAGIISATAFYGDGANLTGVANTAYVVSVATTTGILNVGTGITANSSGIIITGVATATSFSGTVPSSNLSGALPALDGSALTNLNIPAGFNELDAALFN